MSKTRKQAFVLIGTQGSGKSSTGNSIIGNLCFKTQSGTVALTTKIKEIPLEWQTSHITIIDTPPLKGLPEFKKITKDVGANYNNIKYGFVISIGRLQPNEPNLLEIIWEELQAKTELVLIFARYDDLDSGLTFERWLSTCATLKAFIEKTTVKCFPLANKNGINIMKDQVNDLMSAIMGTSKEVNYNKSQAAVNQSTKGDTTINLKHAESQTDLKTQQEIHDQIIVSRHNLEECFGKYGILFYKEMKTKGAK